MMQVILVLFGIIYVKQHLLRPKFDLAEMHNSTQHVGAFFCIEKVWKFIDHVTYYHMNSR